MTKRIVLATATLLTMGVAAARADEADFLAMVQPAPQAVQPRPADASAPRYDQSRGYTSGFSGSFGAAQTAHALGY